MVSPPQNCDQVVQAIEDTGQIKREQKDLEDQVRHAVTHTLPDSTLSCSRVAWSTSSAAACTICSPLLQIDTESGKKVAANLQRIQGDLEQMRAENAQLVGQLKS